MVIMKASTKLETPSLLISSRPHVRGLHPHAEDILTLVDPGLRHIYLVRSVLCASTRTRDDDGFPQKSRISIRSNRRNSQSLYHDWRIYLLIRKLSSVLTSIRKNEGNLKTIEMPSTQFIKNCGCKRYYYTKYQQLRLFIYYRL